MADIHIALVEPEIPQNTGNIARTCSVTGCALDLVGQLGFYLESSRLRRAGLDYWDELEIERYDTIEELQKRLPDYTFVYFSTKAGVCHSDFEYPEKVCLVFGKETAGLPEDLLKRNSERCARIPMADGRRSLNLANSVAIAVYEVLRQRNYGNLNKKGTLL